MTQALTETKKLLISILKTPFNEELKIKAVVGQGSVLVQRCRVELSRIRKKVAGQTTKKLVPFKLKAEVKIVSNGNPPHDLIIFKRVRDSEITIDLSDLDKQLSDMMQEEIKKEENETAGKIVIKRAGSKVS